MLNRDRTFFARSTCSISIISIIIPALLVIFLASSSSTLHLVSGLLTGFTPSIFTTHHYRGRTIFGRTKTKRAAPFVASSSSSSSSSNFHTKNTNMSPAGTEQTTTTTTTELSAREALMTRTTTTTSSSSSSNNWRTIPKPSSSASPSSSSTQDVDDNCYFQQVDDILRRHRDIPWRKECYQDALDFYQQLMACQDSYVKGPIESALHTLDHAYRLYGPESVICSFNGGKDAVVILHLVRAAHAQYYHQLQQQQQQQADDNNTITMVRPRVIYFDHSHQFPEIRSFVQQAVDMYDLDMVAFEEGIKFSDGLKLLVEKNHPSVLHGTGVSSQVTMPMAFVLGTRTTDPNAGQQGPFAPSSHYMPPFMRVNPILDWTYGHVWHFLRQFQLPYCSLYDQGYTSLGTVKDTQPCPALAVAGTAKEDNMTTIPRYWPAYMLRDWDQERAGRISKEKEGMSATNKSPKRPSKVSFAETSSVASSSMGHLSTFSEQQFKTRDAQVEDDEDSSCVSYSGLSELQRTVGLLIIGDEILKGLTADTNSQAAAAALRKRNVLLKRVVVVSDSMEDIVEEIRRLQKEVDVIITSGGVGPTHDDVTIKSVAEALGCQMVLHEEMAELLRNKMNSVDDTELTQAQVKMATLPDKSRLRYLSDDPEEWPVLQCKNIFILPGVPEFFEQKIDNVAEYLCCQLERSVAYKVVLRVDENSIVQTLNSVVENHPNVTIGSYPFVSHPEYKTVITVEGRLLLGGMRNSSVYVRDMIDLSAKEIMDQKVQLALDELINTLPEGSVLRVDNDDLTLFD